MYRISPLKNNSQHDVFRSTLILSKPVFTRIALCRVLTGEVEIAKVLVFCLTRPRLELTIYRIRDEYDKYNTTGVMLQ